MRYIFIILALLGAFTAEAQSTTATLKGFVKDSSGEPLIGATVVATHLPTSTVYGTITDKTGAYHLQGLRVGAPYSVELSFVGYNTEKFENLALALGEVMQIDATLSAYNIEAVVISADNLSQKAKGATSKFNSDIISTTPTASRSIDDITRLAPEVTISKDGGISIAGTNSRYNSFQIDGTASNDMYGLTSTGTNGGLADANPIPLEAIAAIEVVTTPFDVRQGGFTGGGVNAITKSGTNRLSGTAYAYFNNQKFYGRNPITGNALAKQTTQIYGLSLGGAIVKDKLFFFLNGEFNLDSSPSAYYVGYKGCNISESDAKTIADRYYDLTGYDGGGYGEQSLSTKMGSLIARLDWNINSRNNLSLRYNFLDATKDEFASSASLLRFNGEGYTSISDTHSVVAELNSRLSQHIFNQARIGYTRVHDGRDAMSGDKFPFVKIQKLRDNDNTSVYIGTDPFAIMNDLVQHTITITDNFTYYAENHAITVGTHNEIFNSSCLYMANALGAYTYATLDDYLNDRAQEYVRNYAIGDPTTNMTSAQFGLYIQDEWNPSQHFSMTYGLRADLPVVFGTPPTNEAFNATEVAKRYGIKTNQMPSAKILLSPRIGVRWNIVNTKDAKSVLRGGVGIFSGRIPFVWLSNCFSNSGMTQRGYRLYNSIPAFGQEPSGEEGITSNPMINVVSKDFRYPQVARAMVAFEQMYRGWNFTLQGIFTKSINDLLVQNLVAEPQNAKFYAVNAEMANAENSTVIYDTSLSKQFSSIYLMTNTSKGYGYSLSASVAKSFKFGLNLYASYTFAHSYSVMDGISAQAMNTWSRTYSAASNAPELSHSLFDVPHKITASLTYTTPRYAKVLSTTISLLYQGYSGMRYSLTYAGTKDVNGDGSFGNTTLYIPTEQELQAMSFENEQQRSDFGEYIANTPALRRSRGKFLARNAMQTPFENHLDLHIAQDIYFAHKSTRKVQITLDILNLGSLISKSWGASYYLSDYKLSPIEVYDLTIDAQGNRIPKYRYTPTSVSQHDLLSRWRMQLGIKVIF